jgi:SEC-C motif-containing protein
MGCFCGSGKDETLCCLRYIHYGDMAPNPEALMRSRYSAYALGSGRYLVDTTLKKNRYEDDVNLISSHAKSVQWLRLEVLDASEDGRDGYVEFKAYFKEDAKIHVHHEKSVFLKVEGQWFYDQGELFEAKVERNSLCPCGSGTKFKKCCM